MNPKILRESDSERAVNREIDQAGGIRCPFCNSDRYVKNGTTVRQNRRVQVYRCSRDGCLKNFNETNAAREL